MANAVELSAWILRNANKLNLQVERITWIADLFPELTDITTHIKVEGRHYTGWAHGLTEDIAIAKSMAENLERVVMYEQNFATSNGLAAHLEKNLAIRGATYELLERDLFLSHFYARVPFFPSTADQTTLARMKSWFSARGVLVSLYDLGLKGQVCLVDGRNSNRPFGFVVGAAMKDNVQDSLISASIEAARRAHHSMSIRSHEVIRTLALEEFQSIQAPKFHDHGGLALDVNYANQIAYLFESDSSRMDSRQDNFNVISHLFKPSNVLLENCPLVVARATSIDAQDIFLGSVTPEKLNFQRLSQFIGRPLRWEEINPLPHPFA